MLGDLVRAAYEHYVERIGVEPAPMHADYAALVEQGLVWVAADDAAVLGLVVLLPQRDHLLLDNIAVGPSAQGRGIGRTLLEFADNQARELGYAEVRLYTNEHMTENLAFYPRHGYVETERAIVDGYGRVFLTKHL
ncbi:MAG: GNAT family N-acetyltransferase [Actinomycetia bacterium]|nr:GNAT family N-acetyltransferase [Actinomycetes bacterium]